MLDKLPEYFNETNQVSSSNSHRQDQEHQESFLGIRGCISDSSTKSGFFPEQSLILMTDFSEEKVMACSFFL